MAFIAVKDADPRPSFFLHIGPYSEPLSLAGMTVCKMEFTHVTATARPLP